MYILRCADGSLYIGHTSTIDDRVTRHNEGRAECAYTINRRPVAMAYSEAFDSRTLAVRARGEAAFGECSVTRADAQDVKTRELPYFYSTTAPRSSHMPTALIATMTARKISTCRTVRHSRLALIWSSLCRLDTGWCNGVRQESGPNRGIK